MKNCSTPRTALVARYRPALALLALLALPLAGQAQTTAFAFTGNNQTYTVPAGITSVQVVATGASGGAYPSLTNYALGARVQATVTVIPGEVLTVVVGGSGGDATFGGLGTGGFNGGGGGAAAGGGGGATDLRRAGASTGDYLTSRNALVVAGGGGGADDMNGLAGDGGTPDGADGTFQTGASYTGSGATQTGPGLGTDPGVNNVGGTSTIDGGGGGGGYYGGAGNTAGIGVYGGGGGGSSFVAAGSSAITYALALAAGNGALTITPAGTTTTPTLTTGQLSAASYCAGSALTVPFTATGSYGAGNVFTAQLSNASGSFATPVAIGTLTGTSSGNIAATLPATATGGGYRIRVVSSNPAVTGTNNGTNMTITAPQSAGFAYPAATAGNYCAGSTAPLLPTLATGATAGTYALVPGTSTGATLNPTTGALNLSAATAGTFSVTNALPAAGACAATTATRTVTVLPLPAAPVLTSSGSATAGFTLTAAPTAGLTYLFYRNGVLVPGTTGNTYFVNTAAANGTYTVVAQNASGCQSAASAPLLVTATRAGQAAAALRLFPNPAPAGGGATAELTGWAGAGILTLYDALGRAVRSVPVSAAAPAVRLSLTGLTSGTYWVRAQTPGQQLTQRLVVE